MFKYSSRFWLYAPTALFAALAAAVMIHWWIAAAAFEKKLAALNGREAVPGITLNWDSVQVGGFPFRLDANFQNLRIAGQAAHGPFAWHSEKFAMHGLTYGRSQDVYEAAGRQQASWTDEKGRSHSGSFLVGSMRGSSILDAHGLRRFDLDIVEISGDVLAMNHLQFHIRRDPNGNDLDLMAQIDKMYFRHTVDAGVEMAQAYATLTQISPLRALLQGEESWPRAMANWRKSGGVLKQGPAQAKAFPRGVRDPQNIAAAIFGPIY